MLFYFVNVMSYFYVVMWTNLLIISVTLTPVHLLGAIRKSRIRNWEQEFAGRVDSNRVDLTLPLSTKHLSRSHMFPPFQTKPGRFGPWSFRRGSFWPNFIGEPIQPD